VKRKRQVLCVHRGSHQGGELWGGGGGVVGYKKIAVGRGKYDRRTHIIIKEKYKGTDKSQGSKVRTFSRGRTQVLQVRTD